MSSTLCHIRMIVAEMKNSRYIGIEQRL